MKNLIALACTLFVVCTSGLAQEIKTSKSLKTALEQSSLSKKPVLLIINVTSISKPANLPANVKVNFKSALEAPEVVNKINETLSFIKPQ